MANTNKTTAKKNDSTKKKVLTHQEIVKLLRDPNVSRAKKDKLMEKLYDGVDFK